MRKLFLVLGLPLFLASCYCGSIDSFKPPSENPHATGLKRDAKRYKEFLKRVKKHQHKSAPVIPSSFDLSAKANPVQNQANCGSCWDFSLTDALWSAKRLVGVDPGALAFNYLLNNCGPGPSQSGCGGGDFDAGQSFLNNAGPWLESQDPYTQREGSCKSGLPVAATAITFVAVGDGNNPPSFQQLAEAVSENHVLSIDVAVCGAWQSYSGGIFNENQCDSNSINHMINLIGYDCQTSIDSNGHCVFDSNGQPINKDGFLHVRNQWGTSWGEQGDMRTRWGVDAVATTAMYFTVQAPPLPPPPVPQPQPVPSPTPAPTPQPAPTPAPVPESCGFFCGIGKFFSGLVPSGCSKGF